MEVAGWREDTKDSFMVALSFTTFSKRYSRYLGKIDLVSELGLVGVFVDREDIGAEDKMDYVPFLYGS